MSVCGDGNGFKAQFTLSCGPPHLTDLGNNYIRKVSVRPYPTVNRGPGTTFDYLGKIGGGSKQLLATGTSAFFVYPAQLALSADDNFMFYTSTSNAVVYMVDVNSNNMTVLAGKLGTQGVPVDGPASSSVFYRPWGVATNYNGSVVWVSDTSYRNIRKIRYGSAHPGARWNRCLSKPLLQNHFLLQQHQSRRDSSISVQSDGVYACGTAYCRHGGLLGWSRSMGDVFLPQ